MIPPEPPCVVSFSATSCFFWPVYGRMSQARDIMSYLATLSVALVM